MFSGNRSTFAGFISGALLDTAYLSTLAGLAGAVIGGATSFATTWLTTTSQARAARLAAERGARQELYGRYMDEIAALYAAAIRSERVDYDKTTGAFALKGRITLMSSEPRGLRPPNGRLVSWSTCRWARRAPTPRCGR